MQQIADDDGLIRIVLGSNSADPLTETDLTDLLQLVGDGGDTKLTVVSFSNALFHPKTVHVTRADGSAASVVGSANMTARGLGRNVEAGVVLDTRTGVPAALLASVASAIDRWNLGSSAGVLYAQGWAGVFGLRESDAAANGEARRHREASSSARLTSHARRRTRRRRHPAQRHPTTTRTREPRRHFDLSRSHRTRRRHRRDRLAKLGRSGRAEAAIRPGGERGDGDGNPVAAPVEARKRAAGMGQGSVRRVRDWYRIVPRAHHLETAASSPPFTPCARPAENPGKGRAVTVATAIT